MENTRSFELYESNAGTLYVIIEQDGATTLYDEWEHMPKGDVERCLADWYKDPSECEYWDNEQDADDALIAEIRGSDELVLRYAYDGEQWQCCVYPDRMGAAARLALNLRGAI